MNPLRLARKEPNLCDHNALDMAGYRCIFWGPLTGPGVAKINYFFHGLDPDGCLIADWERIRIKSIEKQDADTQKGFLAYWILTLQKKEKYFLRWIGIFYWQAPFNGCLHRYLSTWFFSSTWITESSVFAAFSIFACFSACQVIASPERRVLSSEPVMNFARPLRTKRW